MRPGNWYSTIGFSILFFLCQVLQAQQEVISRPENQLIVKFRDNHPSTRTNNLASIKMIGEPHGLKGQKPIGRSNYLLEFENMTDQAWLIQEYLKTDLFEYVEPNHRGYAAAIYEMEVVPDDPNLNTQWYIKNDGTFILSEAIEGADVEMQKAWEIEQGNGDLVVAFLDGGLKMDHAEFEGRIWSNPSESLNNTDDDENGYEDDINGWNFVNNSNDLEDDSGHGTHVTGVFGARGNNALGLAGIDWNARIMVLKVVDENLSGFYSWWIEAIHYAVDHGADVINMSLGGESFSRALQDAVDFANRNGVLVVSSMQNNNTNTPYYPAAYESVFAVGSSDPNDFRSTSFLNRPSTGSNYGDHIDVIAPGNFIYGIDYLFNNNFNSLRGGTSLATPIVTGIASLLIARNPSISVAQIKQIIRITSEDQVGDPSEDTEGWDQYYGFGRVNAYEALKLDELPVKPGINIYPNPSSRLLNISISNENTARVKIYLVSTSGKIINVFLDEETDTFIQSVDISTLPTGLYQVVVETGSRIETKLFSKVNN